MQVSVIQSPREQGGGYARRGLIVLGGLKDEAYLEKREAYLRYLGHEAAHLWWWAAETTSWEDWLNESLAEYSALLAVRERFGTASFEQRLAQKRTALPGSPAIWGFDRQDMATPERMQEIETVLYSKGPVLLHWLSAEIGHARFLSLCREMVTCGVRSTAQFLSVLARLEGEDIRAWAEDMLRAGDF